MKIGLVEGDQIIEMWHTDSGEVHIRYQLPNGAQISPITMNWRDGDFAVLVVTPFEPPLGKQVVGSPTYYVEGNVIREHYEQVVDIPPAVEPRRMVRKSVVQARLIALEKMNAAYDALTANPVYFARWFAPDRPEVYHDDPDALILLSAIGCTSEQITYVMSEGDAV